MILPGKVAVEVGRPALQLRHWTRASAGRRGENGWRPRAIRVRLGAAHRGQEGSLTVTHRHGSRGPVIRVCPAHRHKGWSVGLRRHPSYCAAVCHQVPFRLWASSGEPFGGRTCGAFVGPPRGMDWTAEVEPDVKAEAGSPKPAGTSSRPSLLGLLLSGRSRRRHAR